MINSVCVLPVTGSLVSGSGDCTVRVWNANTNTCDQILMGHTDVRSVLRYQMSAYC
jgi:WD40 repeat protein